MILYHWHEMWLHPPNRSPPPRFQTPNVTLYYEVGPAYLVWQRESARKNEWFDEGIFFMLLTCRSILYKGWQVTCLLTHQTITCKFGLNNQRVPTNFQNFMLIWHIILVFVSKHRNLACTVLFQYHSCQIKHVYGRKRKKERVS